MQLLIRDDLNEGSNRTAAALKVLDNGLLIKLLNGRRKANANVLEIFLVALLAEI